MSCSISALTEKQVVNLCDGKILGYIVDFKVDICGGYITAIVLPGETSFFGFKKCTDIIIPWNKICKVDIGPISNAEIGENKKKRWFLGC